MREGAGRVETAIHAERFIESVGFASCLTDSRKPGPSLYVAVCGRRDAVMPRNVQKDPESSHTWLLKDEVLRRGKVYYGKLVRGKATFVSPRMIPYFKTLWKVSRREEAGRLSRVALAVLKVLRKEWEMATSELRDATDIRDRARLTHALEELQAAMIVVPTDVVYEPKFTYLWGLAEERFPSEISRKVSRETALREIARCFLDGAGLTIRGELARVTGLSRPDAGLGNRALVKEGYAEMIAPGVYRKAGL
jgi:Winged helix DNA-binding domain